MIMLVLVINDSLPISLFLIFNLYLGVQGGGRGLLLRKPMSKSSYGMAIKGDFRVEMRSS